MVLKRKMLLQFGNITDSCSHFGTPPGEETATEKCDGRWQSRAALCARPLRTRGMREEEGAQR